MGTGILGFIVVGAMFGAIARLFMKGDGSDVLVWTVSLGTIGAFLGGWVAGITHARPGGLASWIWAVVISWMLLGIYAYFNAKQP